jgi:hypothetical protein
MFPHSGQVVQAANGVADGVVPRFRTANAVILKTSISDIPN